MMNHLAAWLLSLDVRLVRMLGLTTILISLVYMAGVQSTLSDQETRPEQPMVEPVPPPTTPTIWVYTPPDTLLDNPFVSHRMEQLVWRYRLRNAAAEAAPEAIPELELEEDTELITVVHPVPLLYRGRLQQLNGNTLAVLAFPADNTERLVREGDKIDGLTIQHIGAQALDLHDGTETHTLPLGLETLVPVPD